MQLDSQERLHSRPGAQACVRAPGRSAPVVMLWNERVLVCGGSRMPIERHGQFRCLAVVFECCLS